MLVELPFHRSPHEVVAPREETASSRLSLETEIDQFKLEEDKEGLGEPLILVLDLEGELDRLSVICSPRLVVARVDGNLEEKGEMLLDNKKKGLCELLKARGMGPTDASRS